MIAYAAVPEYYTRESYDVWWWFNFGMEHLHGYMACRLLWDPDFDVAGLSARTIQGYFTTWLAGAMGGHFALQDDEAFFTMDAPQAAAPVFAVGP